MTIPNGHLYKFMAFFGLLLFISCVLIPYLKFDDNADKIRDIRRNLVVLNHEREALVNDIKAIEDSKTINGLNQTDKSHSDQSTKLKISEIKKGIDLRTEQTGLENQILQEKTDEQHKLKYFMGYFSIFSFLFTTIGLLLWYFKIQRPINRKIKIELVNQPNKD